jgi:predicted HNH restriction endonuclease
MKRGVFKPGEIVHHVVHITPENINDPRITLNWQNLQCLCRDCHADVHKEKKRYTVDQYGRVVATE